MVLLMSIDHREGRPEVQLVDGMYVYSCLETFEQRIALSITEIAVGRIGVVEGIGVDGLGEDVVVDAVEEEGGFEREETVEIVYSKVALPTMLRTEVTIACLVAERAMVDAIRTQFAEVRSTESMGCIGTDVHVAIDVENSS